MEWLKQWVRELVMLVLLAGCLDLLVPMGSLKKYVRMVMGLLVMVSLINPILGLWRAEIRIDQVLEQQSGRLPSIKEVQAEADRYRSRVEAQVSGQFRQQVESRAAEAARAISGIHEATVTAEVAIAADQTPSIASVRVYITPQRPAVAAVQPVEAVQRYADRCDGGDCKATGEMGPAGRPTPPQVDRDLAERVREAVAAALAVESDQVTVLAKEAR